MELNKLKMTSIVQGLLVIAAGVLLYLFNTGVLPVEYKPVVFSWQMLLVAIGFSLLFSFRSWVGGLILLLIGGFFLLQKMQIEALSFITDNGWTIVLVLVGFIILWKSIMGHHGGKRWWEYKDECRQHTSKHYKFKHGESGYIERNFVFGGADEKLDIPDLKGGDINCVFGGVVLDFTDCQLAEGVHILEVNTVFGGIEIYAPVEWNIQVQQNSVFGNFVDNRPKSDVVLDQTKVLIIRASSVFGGGEIKSRSQQ